MLISVFGQPIALLVPFREVPHWSFIESTGYIGLRKCRLYPIQPGYRPHAMRRHRDGSLDMLEYHLILPAYCEECGLWSTGAPEFLWGKECPTCATASVDEGPCPRLISARPALGMARRILTNRSAFLSSICVRLTDRPLPNEGFTTVLGKWVEWDCSVVIGAPTNGPVVECLEYPLFPMKVLKDGAAR